MRQHRFLFSLLGVLGLALSGCSSGGGGGGGAASFDTFVHGVVTQTSETSEPLDVNGQDFNFSEDPAAFDDLFQ